MSAPLVTMHYGEAGCKQTASGWIMNPIRLLTDRIRCRRACWCERGPICESKPCSSLSSRFQLFHPLAAVILLLAQYTESEARLSITACMSKTPCPSCDHHVSLLSANIRGKEEWVDMEIGVTRLLLTFNYCQFYMHKYYASFPQAYYNIHIC